MTTTPFETVQIGAIPFARATLASASAWMVRAARDHDAFAVRLANAYNVSIADSDPAYRRLVERGGINFADGRSIVNAMRLLGANSPAQVRGPSLFAKVVEDGRDVGVRHFLVGSTPRTLEQLTRRLRDRYPGAEILGSYSPPFAPVDDAYVADIVARIPVGTDLVWIGLGTPKQDHVAARVAGESGRLTAAVGAAFDFHAGTVRQAPSWVQRTGMEWFYRLLREPRRMWRRYLFGNSRFLLVVARQRFGRPREHLPAAGVLRRRS